MTKTVADFKIGDRVMDDYGECSIVKQIDDQHVYVEYQDGNYVYFYPDELELIAEEEVREYRDTVLEEVRELIEQWGFKQDELFDTKS